MQSRRQVPWVSVSLSAFGGDENLDNSGKSGEGRGDLHVQEQ